MSNTGGILAGQTWRDRTTGRRLTVLDADNALAGGARVRYRDVQTGRRGCLLIHALQARFERVEDKEDTP